MHDPNEVQDPITIGEAIAAGFMPTGERWPVVRSGERDPIPGHVRLAVFYRDKMRCQMCPAHHAELEGPWHLDHLVPWSAGGSDDSTNLRVLCMTHNMDRGNMRNYDESPRRPVTWWCHRCYTDEHEWTYYTNGYVTCPVHTGYRADWCRVQRMNLRLVEAGATRHELHWHMRDPLTGFDRIAYCAHCNKPGETNRVL